MNHRKFVVTSTVVMFLIAGTVAGLALYTSFAVKASIAGLPEAVAYLPADCQAVFGMNVQKFIASPIYARFQERHGDQVGRDLSEFIAKTGVDPRRDINYIVAGARSIGGSDGKGVVIAAGQFNAAAITTFINSKGTPIKVEYKNATVLMVPEDNGNKVEKGIAFLRDGEIALGDLESLKAVLDVRDTPALGLESNTKLWPLLRDLDPEEMFWFAGEPGSVLSKAPTNNPIGGSLSKVQNVVGSLNLTDAVTGKIVANIADEESAKKLTDVVNGLVALGQLAGADNPDIAELLKGISVTQNKTQIRLAINFSVELLDKLQQSKATFKKVV
jgi:hypothetical protein